MEKVDRRSSDCWDWLASEDRDGYGRFWDGEKHVRAHRFAWTLFRGPIPEGKQVLHECDNPPCVNPDHLFLGTNTDNIKDMMQKGRHAAKLNPVKVREIRDRAAGGETHKSISIDVGVSRPLITEVVNRKLWDHVK